MSTCERATHKFICQDNKCNRAAEQYQQEIACRRHDNCSHISVSIKDCCSCMLRTICVLHVLSYVLATRAARHLSLLTRRLASFAMYLILCCTLFALRIPAAFIKIYFRSENKRWHTNTHTYSVQQQPDYSVGKTTIRKTHIPTSSQVVKTRSLQFSHTNLFNKHELTLLNN